MDKNETKKNSFNWLDVSNYNVWYAIYNWVGYAS